MKTKIRRKWIKYEIDGLGIEKILNSLLNKNFELCNIIKTNRHSCSFEIQKQHENEIEKILINNNIKILNKEYFGFSKVQKIFFERIGFFIALIISIICLFVVNNAVFKVDVVGVKNIDKYEIVECLKSNNVKTIGFATTDNKQIENLLMKNFDKISLVSVVKKGNTLIINIKEKLINDEFENKDDLKPIICEVEGIITKIEHIQGTLKVRKGDYIKKGDVLVEPYMIDSKGEKMPIIPKTKIFVDVFVVGETIHYDVETKVEKTGKIQRVRELYLFGIELFKNNNKIDFVSYETEESEVKLYQNNLLPLTYRDIFYYEVVPVISEIKFDEVKDSCVKKAKEKAFKNIRENEIIKDEYPLINSQLGKTDVKYIVVVERIINE